MTNRMTENELRAKLVGWRKERRIDEMSTAEAQHNCYLEELEEFKDAIGDMIVCLINEQSMHDFIDHEWVENKISQIHQMCLDYNIDFEECLAMAWDEIKDRVCLMRSTGKATKWKDLTHSERLQVAMSGQLMDKPQHVIDSCNEVCSVEEWSEITAAERAVSEA